MVEVDSSFPVSDAGGLPRPGAVAMRATSAFPTPHNHHSNWKFFQHRYLYMRHTVFAYVDSVIQPSRKQRHLLERTVRAFAVRAFLSDVVQLVMRSVKSLCLLA